VPASAQRVRFAVGPEALEDRRELLRHVDGPPVPPLRRLGLPVGKRPRHPDLAPGEVEILPLEGKGFAEAEARPGQAKPEGMLAATFADRGGQKRAELVARHRFDLLLPGSDGGH